MLIFGCYRAGTAASGSANGETQTAVRSSLAELTGRQKPETQPRRSSTGFEQRQAKPLVDERRLRQPQGSFSGRERKMPQRGNPFLKLSFFCLPQARGRRALVLGRPGGLGLNGIEKVGDRGRRQRQGGKLHGPFCKRTDTGCFEQMDSGTELGRASRRSAARHGRRLSNVRCVGIQIKVGGASCSALRGREDG